MTDEKLTEEIARLLPCFADHPAYATIGCNDDGSGHEPDGCPASFRPAVEAFVRTALATAKREAEEAKAEMREAMQIAESELAGAKEEIAGGCWFPWPLSWPLPPRQPPKQADAEGIDE